MGTQALSEAAAPCTDRQHGPWSPTLDPPREGPTGSTFRQAARPARRPREHCELVSLSSPALGPPGSRAWFQIRVHPAAASLGLGVSTHVVIALHVHTQTEHLLLQGLPLNLRRKDSCFRQTGSDGTAKSSGEICLHNGP